MKVSLAVTHKEGFCVGIQTCPGNPFDGHTLDGQLDQAERLAGRVPEMTFVDKGDKGHGGPETRSRVLISGTRKLRRTPKRHLRRRAAIGPEIGHMKGDGLLGRSFLKGMAGDAINAVLCGVGHTLRTFLARLRALLRLLTDGTRAGLRHLLERLEPCLVPRPTLGAAQNGRRGCSGPTTLRRPLWFRTTRLSGRGNSAFPICQVAARWDDLIGSSHHENRGIPICILFIYHKYIRC